MLCVSFIDTNHSNFAEFYQVIDGKHDVEDVMRVLVNDRDFLNPYLYIVEALVDQGHEKEGWPHIYEWQAVPGTVYEEHSHEGKVVLLITEGSIDFTIFGIATTYKAGDRINIPPHTPRFAIVGPQGVQFVVGKETVGYS